MKSKIIVLMLITGLASTMSAQEKIREFGIGFSNFNSFSMQYRWGSDNLLFRLNGTIGYSAGFGKSSSVNSMHNDTSGTHSSSDGKNTSPVNLNGGLYFSIIKLKQLNKKFGILYGLTFGVSATCIKTNSTSSNSSTQYYDSTAAGYATGEYIRMNTTTSITNTIRPTAGVLFGGFYKISESFWLYAEISPNIYYSFNKQKTVSFDQDASYNSYGNRNTKVIHDNQFGVSNLSNSLASLTLVYRFKK